MFSELKVSLQKVKISKDFIFDAKKCQKLLQQSKQNKNFSFKDFNFNIENDWLIRSLKDIYVKIIKIHESQIKNLNKHLSFLTVFYQFDGTKKANKNKQVKIILGNNCNNINNINILNYNNDFLIKEKSKNLTKSIADIIDEYLVIFTFKNAFEANLIHNYINNNKEKMKERCLVKKNNEEKFKSDNLVLLTNKNTENKKINPTNKNSSHKSTINNHPISNSEKTKTTNYRYTETLNNIDFKKSSSNLKNLNNFQYKENIDFVNNSEEATSEVLSVMDIYEASNFFSVNLKLMVNLRSSELLALTSQVIGESIYYPLKIKQEEDNIYIFFFETEIEREILVNYHKEKIKNANPIKNYESLYVISKTKCLEFAKGAHKESKESVEIKKYFKKNLKSEKILKEINSLRDLSMVYKFFEDSKIPKILFFENSEEIYFVYENYENDSIKFIFMNPDLKVTKEITKYSLNIKKMKELKNMLDILSISFSPDSNGEI